MAHSELLLLSLLTTAGIMLAVHVGGKKDGK